MPDKALLTLNDKAQKDLLRMFFSTREEMENKRINEVTLGEALERVIGVGLVDPAELVEHAGAFDLERRDRAEQVPLAFHMIFQLAAAADDEALFGHVEPVERAGEMTAVPLIWIKGRRGRQAHPRERRPPLPAPPAARGRWVLARPFMR